MGNRKLLVSMVQHRAVYIASQAVLLACEQGAFRTAELRDELDLPRDSIPSNSAIRGVLRQLEEEGWLERHHPQGRIWYAGQNLASTKDQNSF